MTLAMILNPAAIHAFLGEGWGDMPDISRHFCETAVNMIYMSFG